MHKYSTPILSLSGPNQDIIDNNAISGDPPVGVSSADGIALLCSLLLSLFVNLCMTDFHPSKELLET